MREKSFFSATGKEKQTKEHKRYHTFTMTFLLAAFSFQEMTGNSL